jgi:PAS domain S-box-containing protein
MTSASATLLVVDDEEFNRDMLARRLQRAGFQVRLAEDGQQALREVDGGAIDLVLLDVMMPGLNGYEVLRRLRASPAPVRVPVIMVTAKTQSEDIVEALNLGADDYVTKPIDLPVALARIKTQLARRHAERALTESEERYALAVDGANDGLWDWRAADDVFYGSPRWSEIMGGPRAAANGTLETWLSFVHADDAERVRAEFDEHAAGHTDHFESEHRVRHGESHRWVLVRGRAVRGPNGAAQRVAGSITDITEGKVADALTGLPNRVLFNDRLGRLFEYARRVPEFQFAVMFLDLDRFKNVNDSLGHRAGDQLLVETARRLETHLRATDSVMRLAGPAGRGLSRLAGNTLARFGGDEFAIILTSIHRPSDATRVAGRLGQAVAEPFDISGQEVFVSASIGIALNVTGYERPEDMLRDADTALYRAKAAGRGCYELFDSAMRDHVVQQLQLETDLRHALERDEFELHYQPIVALTTGRVTGVEALIRWRHPTRGLLAPGEFLSTAEDTNLIGPIGAWVLERVCAQIASWSAAGPEATQPIVAVNTAVRHLLAPDFVERAMQVVAAHGVVPGLIEFEITESGLMADPDAVRTVVERLKAAGFRVAIDDFGTGYSSLSYLQHLHVDRLKLDRSFVDAMLTRGEAHAVMESVVILAERLQLEVVAEGIETIAQLKQVESLGCGFGQGFYFSRPVPPGTTSDWPLVQERDEARPEGEPPTTPSERSDSR